VVDVSDGSTVYDEHVEAYLEFVDRVLASEPSLFRTMVEIIARMVGDDLDAARVLDLCCGEGYMSRHFAATGAERVTGIDISAALVDIAQLRSDAPNLSFHVDDARILSTIRDASIDVCVSQMAVMDVADHGAMFRAVRRVLVRGGSFVFSLLHPCFEGPFAPPDQDPLLRDDDGDPVARVVWRYATEGYFKPEGGGVRGHVGSFHRMLSTYLNDLRMSGFAFEAMDEPVLEGAGLFSEVPRVMIVSATAV
jgi:SAM-dependent methyltransferase